MSPEHDSSLNRSRIRPSSRLADRVLAYLRPLLRYANTEIRAYEALELLPRGQVNAADIVDAALVEALKAESQAPGPGGGEFAWLRGFVERALRREVETARRNRGQRSLFEPVGLARRGDDATGTPRRLIDVVPNPQSPIPDQVIESREFQEALLRLLRELPAAWREPFILHVRDGLSVSEIARLEGVSQREARRRIDLARAFLRARLEEEYAEAPELAPSESIFELLQRVEPTPDQVARTRAQLDAAA